VIMNKMRRRKVGGYSQPVLEDLSSDAIPLLRKLRRGATIWVMENHCANRN
jgi:hypothetical protein